jgi:hypothetical protein
MNGIEFHATTGPCWCGQEHARDEAQKLAIGDIMAGVRRQAKRIRKLEREAHRWPEWRD